MSPSLSAISVHQRYTMGDQAFNSKFVGVVEKYPVLYNYKLKGYSRKNVTDKAWNEVANEVNLTAQECKEKWKNLRSVFVRHMKPLPFGSGNKKPYYLAEAMKFTLPYIKTLGTPIGNFYELPYEHEPLPSAAQDSSDLSENIQDLTEEEEDTYVHVEANTPPSPSHLAPVQQLSISSLGQARLSQKITDDPDFSPRIPKRKKESVTDVEESFAEFLKAKKQKTATTSYDSSQGKRTFLLSLLPEIEPMTDAQMRSFRRRVLQLIDDIMMRTNQFQLLQTQNYLLATSTHSTQTMDITSES